MEYIVQCSTVQYSTAQYSRVQYSTVQYSTVQYSTVQYTVLHFVAGHCGFPSVHITYRSSLYSTQNDLQWYRVHWSSLQYSIHTNVCEYYCIHGPWIYIISYQMLTKYHTLTTKRVLTSMLPMAESASERSDLQKEQFATLYRNWTDSARWIQ